MFRLLHFVLCAAGMIGFWYAIEFGVHEMTPEFRNGFLAGGAFVLAFLGIALWLEKRNAADPDIIAPPASGLPNRLPE